ncbi:MAG: hypothetical protein M3445_04355 [Actinomycetota bacterium]|nr:hypothetical protein [Actinomycetota bacterium]
MVAQVSLSGAQAYDVDDVPDRPVTPYVVLSTDLGLGGAYRNSGDRGRTRWRIVALLVGSTADEARHAAERVATALDGRRVWVVGHDCSPVRDESSRPVAPDYDKPDLFSGTSVWTFTTAPSA